MASGARPEWGPLTKVLAFLLNLRRPLRRLIPQRPTVGERTFRVHSTDDRSESRGQYLVQLTAEGADAARLRLSRYVAIGYEGSLAIAKLTRAHDEPRDEDDKLGRVGCALDQTIRAIVGIESAPKSGQSTASPRPPKVPVTLTPMRLPHHGVPGIAPRRLLLHYTVLPLEYIEKRIVCLSELSLRLLGVKEGEYITLVCATGEPPDITVRSVSVRAFEVPDKEILKNYKDAKEFPDITRNIYMDRDIRKELGIPPGRRGYPILVAPGVRSLLRARLIFYGVSAFLGFTAFNEIVQGLTNDLSKSAEIGIAGGFALLFSVVFAIFDLRGHLQN